MIDFWLAIGLLLLVALGFLLIPAIRRQHVASGKDRAAVNVELYEERLTELSQQHAAGLLTAEQWEEARSEAARELLSDTQQADTDATSAKGGRAAPLIVALIRSLDLDSTCIGVPATGSSSLASSASRRAPWMK